MARTTRPTSDSYDFQVVQEPLFNRGGKAAVVGKSPVMGNFRTDTGQCLGTSTEAYAIVQKGRGCDPCRKGNTPSPHPRKGVGIFFD